MYCLSRQCGLCHFGFKNGDNFVVAQCAPRVNGFRPIRETSYKICTGSCSHTSGVRNRCHFNCQRLVPAASVDKLSSIAWYSYDLLPSEEQARRDWLRDDLGSRLKGTLSIPFEVAIKISQHLVQEYAAILVSLLPYRRAGMTTINLKAPIMKRYVNFEGKRYISSMENANIQNSPGDESEGSKYLGVLYLSEDYCGVTDMLFCRETDPPPAVEPVPGVWWKSLPIKDPEAELSLFNDGLKLRYITYKNLCTKGMMSFATPTPPEGLHFQTFRDFKTTRPRQMIPLRFNHPDITGISIRCNLDPRAFYAHTAATDASFYKSSSDHDVWMYIPLPKGDFISKIWIRQRKNQELEMEEALAFETNKGQIKLAGGYGSRFTSWFPWTLVHTSDGAPSQFLFESHPAGIRGLFFESPPAPTEYASPLPPTLSPTLRVGTTDKFYYSSATLNGVTSLRKCYRERWGYPEIIGLLFEYEDGGMATVGQVRLDYLAEPVTVDTFGHENIWFRFKSIEGEVQDQLPRGRRDYIADVGFSGPADEDPWWISLPWEGTLEWWFSNRQCMLWHNGEECKPGVVPEDEDEAMHSAWEWVSAS